VILNMPPTTVGEVRELSREGLTGSAEVLRLAPMGIVKRTPNRKPNMMPKMRAVTVCRVRWRVAREEALMEENGISSPAGRSTWPSAAIVDANFVTCIEVFELRSGIQNKGNRNSTG
jgi:hypothetical protein